MRALALLVAALEACAAVGLAAAASQDAHAADIAEREPSTFCSLRPGDPPRYPPPPGAYWGNVASARAAALSSRVASASAACICRDVALARRSAE